MVASIGLFATICCEPRQVRKEATVTTDSGAEVRLILAPPFSCTTSTDYPFFPSIRPISIDKQPLPTITLRNIDMIKKSIIALFVYCCIATIYANTPPEITDIYCSPKGIVLLFNIPGEINVWSSDDRQLGYYAFSGLEQAADGTFVIKAESNKGFPHDLLLGRYDEIHDRVIIDQSRYWRGVYHTPC